MEAPYSCDHNTRQGQTYWRLDTKKNLSLADIGTYLRMQPSVSELHQFEKENADALEPLLLEVHLGRQAMQGRHDRR